MQSTIDNRHSAVLDSFQRPAKDLRISVTDRCNFRCSYCMPEEGMQWLAKDKLLSFEEITRLASLLASLGVTKIRLTGGEPLMRKELWRLVAMLRGISGIRDLALTTNGYFLKEQAQQLADAGLDRINVSLDSLDPKVFNEMARRDYFDKTWAGIEKAEQAGISPIKLNVVLIRGMNDGEILRFAELARSRRFVIRFIEFMPIGKDDGWAMDKVVPTREVLDIINSYSRLIAMPSRNGAPPADKFVFADGKGEIGFISSVSEPFCTNCDRVRLTSDGKFRTCLFSLIETDLRTMLRRGDDDMEISEAIVNAVARKEEGHLINRPGFVRPERTMSQIGG